MPVTAINYKNPPAPMERRVFDTLHLFDGTVEGFTPPIPYPPNAKTTQDTRTQVQQGMTRQSNKHMQQGMTKQEQERTMNE